MVEGLVKDLVLVGGGHAHVQVLRSLAMAPLAATRVTLIVDTPIAVYSGMVPGFVAGQYAAHELEIDVNPLARAAGARLVVAAMTGIDTERRRIRVAGRPAIRYDLASLDIGSTVDGLDLPGVREHALPTRPIGGLVERVDAYLAAARARSAGATFEVVVVGGGAGGVELAFALDHRLGAVLGAKQSPAGAGVTAPGYAVTLVHAGPVLVPGLPAGLAARIGNEARARRIQVRLDTRVVAASTGSIRLGSGETLPADALVWVAGATATPPLRDSGLPLDARGFIRVSDTLEVEDHPGLFAAGDCATLNSYPTTPKAGVYAVRQGPLLDANLRAARAGQTLEPYRPQRDFLALLNLGDGRALGAKWGVSFAGRWVMRLKDRIDRAFMRRFQVLDAGGAPSPDPMAPRPMAAAGTSMLCGGCAAKVGGDVLTRALGRLEPPIEATDVLLGLAGRDDVAAILTPGGDVVVSSIDAFRAFTDDPWLVGRVAAINAVSDLQAKGVEPRHALALVAVPENEDPEQAEDTLYQVLSGARAALDPLGVSLLGGHTTTTSELLVGFTVDGVARSARELLRNDALRPGQALLLTRPLGTGVLFHADMHAACSGRWRQAAIAQMLRSNAGAMAVARALGATAATDVTGFGLALHLAQMLQGSGLGATLWLDALPALPGALTLLERGLRSTSQAQNERALRGSIAMGDLAQHPRLPLLFDPQTSGGLLLGIATEHCAEALERLHAGGETGAARIGTVRDLDPGRGMIDLLPGP